MEKFWDKEQIFFDGDEYFEQMFKDIDLAKNLITVEVYMFNNDGLGKKISKHLIEAHKRGLRVQIIVDGIGSFDFMNELYDEFSKCGLRVKVYNPIPFFHPINNGYNLSKRIQTFINRVGRINSRNHRKIVTIDESIMYTGSFNFAAEHTSYHHDTKWKDLGVRVSGQNVREAVLNFKRIWNIRDYFKYKKALRKEAKVGKNSPLRINHSVFMRRFYYRDLIDKIQKAEKKIWIMTPYFIPKKRLIKLLGNAAQRGVDVKLLISYKSDIRLFQTLQFFYYPYLLQQGVSIYQYTETILHAKNFIIDNWITIGSSNLNHRSLLHDLEVDLVIQDQQNKENILKHFEHSLLDQKEITIDSLKQRTVFDKFLARLFFIFKYWF